MLAIRCGDRFVLSGKLICDAIKQMRDGAALAAKQLTASGPFTPAPDVRGDTDHTLFFFFFFFFFPLP